MGGKGDEREQVDYFQQLTECQSKQERLEQIACEVHERTNESCRALPSCYEGKWSTYSSEVQSANSTFQAPISLA